ncbi:phosphate/phosphite/phosphonate ABC transporter substrate-binding protein [Thiomicrorhabdus sp. zzn3]|uniref:phosphate/phosphite/phosphonate ABC transporter substrate-binding protein n=1 Tax=Thiomicrorhabdus sp. zzn3 TaxID=3039775 RepID=UPI002436C5A8|nr:phosphate/phosphite/phosphonate ABC transporter substrate-binding protein [Thiomicrorhabdus sp. zzn3]MDG6777220.1 phosphate/phosphite/phosphonate ABC transporter substrate-binding protein [Thiomicrorhabdus sp. zzn3]
MMHTLSYKLILVLFLTPLTLLSGCSEEASSSTEPVFISKTISTPEYAFAVHPLHNPTRLFEVFNPLVEYLNQHIPEAHFRVEASRDYATFNQKLKNRSVAFALPNPYQTLMAIDHHYHVIAKMGDDENFKGIILVRKDSGIHTPADLKGKAVSYPAPTALAATMLPQDYLQRHGIDINRDIQNRYVGSQESSIMNVFIGATAAGATWPPPWRALSNERPELKEQLKVIWQTESLPNNSVVVRDDIPASVADKVSTLLTQLHTTPEGQTILKGMYLSRYEPADNSTYQPVKEFVTQFSERVRPLN